MTIAKTWHSALYNPKSLTVVSDALKSLDIASSYLSLQVFLYISTTALFVIAGESTCTCSILEAHTS